MSSISGAIRKVMPTSNRHMISSKQAVAIIVQRARCDRSSGSITCVHKTEIHQPKMVRLVYYFGTIQLGLIICIDQNFNPVRG